MNVNISMLKNKQAKVWDRLYSNTRDYLGLITKLDYGKRTIELRTKNIHHNSYNF